MEIIKILIMAMGGPIIKVFKKNKIPSNAELDFGGFYFYF